MKAEILCIGSELILGDTVNTNASYISKKLSELGIDCYFHTATGDNPARIKKCLDTALNRVSLVIITGGLGPTDDDITMEVIADYLNKNLFTDEESLKTAEEFFRKRNLEPPQKARKQAMFPEGAKIIKNPVGTAPGAIIELEKNSQKKIIMTFPGVPRELYKMWEETAGNYLEQFSQGTLVKKILRFIEIPEGTLGEKVADLMEKPNPTVAPLVAEGHPTLRIAAKADSPEEAEKLVRHAEKEILNRVGQYLWGYDEDSLEEVVGKLLIKRNLTISLAESCTGGLISSRLTDVSGSSAYILLNFVTYSNEAKINTLGVPAEIIEKYGAVSEQTAKAMAECVRKKAGTDIGLGISGIAGPTGGTPEKPVGLVYIGISDGKKTKVEKFNINHRFDRKTIKFSASQYALNMIRKFILEN